MDKISAPQGSEEWRQAHMARLYAGATWLVS